MTLNAPKCRFQKVANFQTSAAPKSGYFASYEENVFPAARQAILKGGKFYDMFTAGDGHELEDYTDCNGVSRLAHAKSALSSSMLAYNFFHWVSPKHPLTWHGTTFDTLIGMNCPPPNLNQKDMTGAGQSADGVKFLWNGQLFILLPDGTRYDATGKKVE